MKYLIIFTLILCGQMINAQNRQSDNFTFRDMSITRSYNDTLVFNKIDISTFFDQMINLSKQKDVNDRSLKYVRDSIKFEIHKRKVLDSLNKSIIQTKSNIRKVDILEAAWLKMNNLDSELSTPLYADILTMKRMLLETDKENIIFEKVVRKLKFEDDVNKLDSPIKGNFDEKKFIEMQKKLNKNYIDFVKKENSSGESNTATIPQISTINKNFNPSISILGATEINKLGRYKLEFFIGNGSTDTISVATILVPELSRYGIQINGFNNLNKAIGFNSNLNFHEKKSFNSIENKEFTFSRIQAKIGLEALVFKDIFSMYGNFNLIIPVTNTEKYKEQFAPDKKDLSYWDFGIKMFLTPKGILTKSGGLGLFVDLNFISTTEIIKKYNGNADSMIPNIKFGLQKNFR